VFWGVVCRHTGYRQGKQLTSQGPVCVMCRGVVCVSEWGVTRACCCALAVAGAARSLCWGHYPESQESITLGLFSRNMG
jgi:hypothetical protein